MSVSSEQMARAMILNAIADDNLVLLKELLSLEDEKGSETYFFKEAARKNSHKCAEYLINHPNANLDHILKTAAKYGDTEIVLLAMSKFSTLTEGNIKSLLKYTFKREEDLSLIVERTKHVIDTILLVDKEEGLAKLKSIAPKIVDIHIEKQSFEFADYYFNLVSINEDSDIDVDLSRVFNRLIKNAVLTGDLNIVKYIMKFRNYDLSFEDNEFVKHIAVGKSAEIFDLIYSDSRVELDAEDSYLFKIIGKKGRVEFFEKLKNLGFDIKAQMYVALKNAIKYDKSEFVDYILDNFDLSENLSQLELKKLCHQGVKKGLVKFVKAAILNITDFSDTLKIDLFETCVESLDDDSDESIKNKDEILYMLFKNVLGSRFENFPDYFREEDNIENFNLIKSKILNYRMEKIQQMTYHAAIVKSHNVWGELPKELRDLVVHFANNNSQLSKVEKIKAFGTGEDIITRREIKDEKLISLAPKKPAHPSRRLG